MICRFPILLRDEKGRSFYVPCGHCAWCLRSLRDQWVLRMHHEDKLHRFSSFVTLTYRDEDLPFNVDEETGEMVNSVRKLDIQEFHKSLWNRGFDFRFFVTSEYGSKTLRPHYHAIYWHDDPIDFEKEWPKGDNNVQLPARESSFKYVLKYILKGSVVPRAADENFRLMSRRPGIGSNFIYKGTPYIVMPGGVKCAVPHYYSRNYENSLNDKLKAVLKDSKKDYLSGLDRHESLRKIFKNSTQLEPGTMEFEKSFELWITELYRKDFVKQCKINTKNGNI